MALSQWTKSVWQALAKTMLTTDDGTDFCFKDSKEFHADNTCLSFPKATERSYSDMVFEFESSEMQLPMYTSTPTKLMKNKHDSYNMYDSGIIQENENDISIWNESFEEAVKEKKIPVPSYRKTSSKLYTKALQSSDEVPRFFCSRQCLKHLSPLDVQRMRQKYWTKSFENKVEWFIDKVTESQDVVQENKKMFFVIEGRKSVCGTCFRKLYKIGKGFYYKYLRSAREGHMSAGLRQPRGVSSPRKIAEVWLNNYVFYHADRMPDNGDLMLPYKTRKIDVYHLYRDELTTDFKYAVGKSLFYEIWNNKKNLKIKQTNSFSKCNTCVQLERELEKTRSMEGREDLKKKVAVHNDRQMNERHYYYEKRDMARREPKQYLSLIIDGMDQSKTNLPHFTGRLLKGVDPNNFLKTHVQGVLNHGCGTFKCYVDINEYSHDANLVMNCILREIYATQKKLGQLPRILFIQADNCARENKNKFVLGFCELLVRLKIFSEVHLSFLPVGHTHEDVDAKFATVADILRRNDAETLPALLNLLPGSPQQTRGLLDIKDWVVKCSNKIKDHSKPLHFKFSTVFGDTVFQYRMNCKREWRLAPHPLIKQLPTKQPVVLCPPHFLKILTPSLRDTISKFRYQMSDNQYWWWQRFIEEVEAIQMIVRTDEFVGKWKEYATYEADWILPNLNKIDVTKEHQPYIARQHINEIMDRELDDYFIQVTPVNKKEKRKRQEDK